MVSTLRVRFPLFLVTAMACTQTGETGSGDTGQSVAASAQNVRTGAAAFADWTGDAPGVGYHIRASDLSAPVMTGTDPEASIAKPAEVVPQPQGATLKVPDGFVVNVFATGLKQPRRVHIAPNGDIFVSESGTGRVLVFRGSDGDSVNRQPKVFAENLDRPYGIAFLPPANPQYVYVAAANQVVRYPYRDGDIKASGPRRSDRRQHPDRAALDTGPRRVAGRPTTVPRRRLGIEPWRRWHAGDDS
jgi:hypothetical protein